MGDSAPTTTESSAVLCSQCRRALREANIEVGGEETREEEDDKGSGDGEDNKGQYLCEVTRTGLI